MRIQSKYAGRCSSCKQWFLAGAEIEYERGVGAICLKCAAEPAEPERDLHQLADALGFVPSADSLLITWTHFCYRNEDDKQQRLFA